MWTDFSCGWRNDFASSWKNPSKLYPLLRCESGGRARLCKSLNFATTTTTKKNYKNLSAASWSFPSDARGSEFDQKCYM